MNGKTIFSAAEVLSPNARKELQLKRLQDTISKVYESGSFYGEQMRRQGIRPDSIRSFESMQILPMTTKQDMRDNYPYGLLAVPPKEIVRYHSSSGTTGKPTAVAYTRNDLEVWKEVLARTLVMGGLSADSVFQVAVNYGMFTGGLGMHYAAESIGASVLPMSSGNTQRQIMLIQDFLTTAMVITPSYALHLAEAMTEAGINPRETSLEILFCGAEAWSDGMRKKIEESLNVKAFDVYGLSEIIGPGVASECECQNGLHLQEDHFYPEIIDPVSGVVLPEGEVGELVLTTLTKEGMPMIRYRTRDLTALDCSPCACGRTTVRMRRVTGRTDDMLIIRGANIFPSQIESVLLGMGESAPHYQLIVDRKDNLDTLEVQLEASELLKSCRREEIKAAEARIKSRLTAALGVKLDVTIVPARTIPRSEGKAKRVIDNRRAG